MLPGGWDMKELDATWALPADGSCWEGGPNVWGATALGITTLSLAMSTRV